MRIISFFLPFFSILAGGAGFFIRSAELSSVFDRVTGLPARGAFVTYALIVLTAAVLIAAVVFAIRTSVKYVSLDGFDNAFGTDGFSYPIAFTVIGVVWFGAAVSRYLGFSSDGDVPATELIFAILSVLSAVSLVFFAIEMYKNPRRKLVFALSIVPTLFMCFWLVVLYRENASNHILLIYAYQCLAIIAATLGFYFTSGFVYGKSPVGKAIVSYVASIFFCMVTLADDHPLAIRLVFVAIVAVNVLYSSMLVSNLQRKTQIGEFR